MDNLTFWQKIATYLSVAGILLPILAGFITYFAYLATNKVAEIEKVQATARISEANARSDSAKAQSDVAIAEASNANVRAAEANEKTKEHELKIIQSEEVQQQLIIEAASAKTKQLEAEFALEKLRQSIDKVEKDQQPRHLTQKQKEILLSHLSKPLPDRSTRILRLDVPFGDIEALNFYKEFTEIFKLAGWTTHNPTIGQFTEAQLGLLLYVPMDKKNNRWSSAVEPLSNAFQAIGMPLDIVAHDVTDNNFMVQLVVGTKIPPSK